MFGKNIKELRIEKGMTQQELANEIGVSQGAVFFWEKEINEPTAGYLMKMAKLFDVSVDELLSFENGKEIKLSKETQILEYFNKLNDEQQDLLLRLLREMAQK